MCLFALDFQLGFAVHLIICFIDTSLVLKVEMCTKGMLAAEATFNALVEGSSMDLYWENLKKSWIWDELYRARNYRPVCGYYYYYEFPK